MASQLRMFTRVPRVRTFPAATIQPRRFAHQSYGNEQSGHEQDLKSKNPKEHLEHPGPEAPALQGKGQNQNSASTQSSSSSAQPKIHTPKSAAEDTDPDVRKHNEEMANRAEKTANQLSESDNKVDKQFWKGDVGDMSKKNG